VGGVFVGCGGGVIASGIWRYGSGSGQALGTDPMVPALVVAVVAALAALLAAATAAAVHALVTDHVQRVGSSTVHPVLAATALDFWWALGAGGMVLSVAESGMGLELPQILLGSVVLVIGGGVLGLGLAVRAGSTWIGRPLTIGDLTVGERPAASTPVPPGTWWHGR
jgi:hypothetical protein